MSVGAFISSATFSDGTKLDFKDNDIVVLVGPNNAGKSLALADLVRIFSGTANTTGRVVTGCQRTLKGSFDELLQWLETGSYVYRHPGNTLFSAYGTNIDENRARFAWGNHLSHGLGELSKFFVRHLNTEQRLKLVHPPESVSLTSTAPRHPIHYLQRDDQIENRVSCYFRQSFGVDVIVHHNSGSDVPLYIGNRPEIRDDEDRVSSRYLREVEQLPKLHEQGDGMRSFAGVLLHAVVGNHSLVLVDEPEAFLHPPQARLLGQMLAKETPGDRQLFIATHSTEVLQGLLDANKGNLRVIRLIRDGAANRIRELQTADVQQLWADPLLRHSDVLSGLFHERVVVCESDADCRFYAAVADTLFEDSIVGRRDVMFVHCGGKGRIPLVVRALRSVGVPVSAVADFDILSDQQPLRTIVESLGGMWTDIEKDWHVVNSSISSKKPELSTVELKTEIVSILDKINESAFPKAASQRILSVLRRSSPWSVAKNNGKAFVPSGDPFNACTRLFEQFARIGLFVVEVGELEGFARSVGGHGPQWVNGVLPKVTSRDSELTTARNFVQRLIS